RLSETRAGHGRGVSESGQDLVEFALLLPLLLLILLGIMEFGFAVFRYNTVANVGREVARYGVVHPNAPDIDELLYTQPEGARDEYTEDILRWARGLISDTDTLSITYALRNSGWPSSTVQVTVTYGHSFLTGPIILAVGGTPTVSLRSVSTMYTESPATPFP
ncbi:MAG: pilus assembly protein, partial [Anaerolineae bacterium]|nr:pilus assembly protein [Anaerolineae bacterium]